MNNELRTLRYILTTFLLATILSAQAQVPSPAKNMEGPLVLMNGIAHIGNGEVIGNSIITMEDGKIGMVADARKVRMDMSGYKVLDVSGKHIYPGLILPNTNLGLVEVSAVRATVDDDETGSIIPHVRSIVAYNAESKLIPTLRSIGILLAQVTPQGGTISGTSSVVQLDAWNWEDAAYKTDGGIHLNWPSMFTRAGWWSESREATKNENYNKEVADLEALFTSASSYNAFEEPKVVNLILKSMQGLFNGTTTLFIHADYGKEIIAGIQFSKQQNVEKVVIVGGEDAMMAIDFLKQHEVPVILSSLHRLPNRPEEDVDMPYKLPYLLHKEGILVSLGYEGLTNSRNLPFSAGTAAGFGLSKEQALMTVTSNTAKILGIDDRTGTLEQGKDANIIISTGDVLDMRTNNIEHAFIQGRKIDLSDKHKALYRKYQEKYEGE
jgi:imidazolonepropionase-like amidohydrolase